MASMTGLAAGLCNVNALTTDFKKLSTLSSGHLSLNANVVSKPLVYSSSAHQRSRNNCRTLRVYSLSGENEANEKGDEKSSEAGNLENLKKLYMTLKKAEKVIRAKAVKATKEINVKEFDGYSKHKLVKATLTGKQRPVRIEFTRAAIKLHPKKLSLLVTQAFKDAHDKSVQDTRKKFRDLAKSLGLTTGLEG